jgi:hypothetical protein
MAALPPPRQRRAKRKSLLAREPGFAVKRWQAQFLICVGVRDGQSAVAGKIAVIAQ